MDLNRLFLFIVIVSSLLVLGRSVRRPQALPWISALIVLAITGIAFLFERRVAGWIAITAWLVILFLPAMISGWRRRVPGRPRQLTLTPVVTMLIVANAAMFLVELALGGSMNPETLHRLGELDSAAVWFNHEYWRLFTALFLHYGALHLAFNLYALWIIICGNKHVKPGSSDGVFFYILNWQALIVFKRKRKVVIVCVAILLNEVFDRHFGNVIVNIAEAFV